MSIQDVILFISSTSESCKPSIRFIDQNEIPVKIIRLDTLKDRQNAINGKYFQVHNVPTLLVMYTDDNIQLFVGSEKIILWLTQISQRGKVEEKDSYKLNVEKPQREKPQREKPQPKNLKHSDKKNQDKKKKKKKPIIFEESSSEEEEEEEDIEYYKADIPIKDTPISNLKQKPYHNQKPESIVDIARKMEAERKENLGYNEKDL
jgi:hypothetical protein